MADPYEIQDALGYIPDHGVIPALVNIPIMFIAPHQRTVSSGEVWIGVSNQDPNYGGCIVFISNDGTTYYEIDRIKGNATQGVLTAALPSVAGIDTSSVLSVDLTMSGTILESVDQETVLAADSLCHVGGELLAYRDAVSTGTHSYDLDYLKRGLYGSSTGAASGASFLLCDDVIMRYRFNKARVGGTLYFKFMAFNSYDAGFQDMADLVEYSVVLTSDGGIKALLGDIPSLDNTNLTGIPTAPTAVPGTNTTQISTTAFVQAALAALIDSSPATLDTLNELAAALGDDPNFSTTILTLLAGKQATLVSGANIKTVNGNSLLGSGNVTISGGGGTESGAAKAYKYLNY